MKKEVEQNDEFQIELIGAHKLELKEETEVVRDKIVAAFKSVQNMADILISSKSEKDLNGEYYNEEHTNIISVLGDRGSGKSSTLITLKKIIHDAAKKESITDDTKLSLKNCLFLSSLIDPSVIDDCGSILTLIISLLFKEFDQIEEGVSEDTRRSIINQFIDISETISTLDNKNKTNDALDDLLSNAEIFRISVKLEELIDKYLSIKSNVDRKEKRISYDYKQLVIVIDDIDLNQKGCYKMLEELRKYFCLTNVIIVISASLNDITRVVVNHFDKNNKFSKDYIVYQSGDEKNDPVKIYNYTLDVLARKYINKVLPYPLRVDLQINQEIYINYIICKYQSIGVYFEKFSKNQQRNFLPDSLREIIQLVYELERGENTFEILCKYFKNYIPRNKSSFVKYDVLDWSFLQSCKKSTKDNWIQLKKELEETFAKCDNKKQIEEDIYIYLSLCYLYVELIKLINCENSMEILSLFDSYFNDRNKVLYDNSFQYDREILLLFNPEYIKKTRKNFVKITSIDLIKWNFEINKTYDDYIKNSYNLLLNLLIFRYTMSNPAPLNNIQTISDAYSIDFSEILNDIKDTGHNEYINKFISRKSIHNLEFALKQKVKLPIDIFKSVMEDIYGSYNIFNYERYNSLSEAVCLNLYQFILREIKNAQ